MNVLSEKERKELREKVSSDLYLLTKGILGYRELVPGLHKRLAEFITTAPQHRAIVLPRGHFKTTVSTKGFVVWLTLPDTTGQWKALFPFKGPNVRVLIVSANFSNASKMLREIREQYESNQLLRALFPELIPNIRKVKWNDGEFCLARSATHSEATVTAFGIGGKAASTHYDVIIIDDPIDPENKAVPSKEEIDRATEFADTTNPLLNSPKEGIVQHIGTRWAYWDYLAHIAEKLPRSAVFEEKAIREGRWDVGAPTSESGIYGQFVEGEPLFPERFSLETLSKIRRDSGDYSFSSQYLNDPVPSEQLVFRPQDDRFFERLPNLITGLNFYVLVDPAISTKKQACRTAIVRVAVHSSGAYYIDDYFVGRITNHETIQRTCEMVTRSVAPPKSCGVEAVAYQEALKNDLEREFIQRGIHTVVEPVRPGSNESKEMRIQSLQPIHQRAQFFIRTWMDELLLEMRQFPFGKYVDILDAISYTSKIAFTPVKAEEDGTATVVQWLMDRGKSEAEAHAIVSGGIRSDHTEGPQDTLNMILGSVDSVHNRRKVGVFAHQMKAFNFGAAIH